MCRQVGIQTVVDRDHYMFCGNPIRFDSTVTTVPSMHFKERSSMCESANIVKGYGHSQRCLCGEVVMSSALLMLLEPWQ